MTTKIQFSKEDAKLVVDGERRVWQARCRVPFNFHVTENMSIRYKETKEESRSVPAFADLPAAPADLSWSFDTEESNEVLGDDNWERFKEAHSWFDPEKGEVKDGFKLPIAKMYEGKLHVFWSGVAAAMGALLGARGGVDIPETDKEAVYKYLSKYYEKFDKEAPEMRAKKKKKKYSRSSDDDIILDGIASSTSVDWHGTEMSLGALQEMSQQFNKGVPYIPSHTDDEWDQVMGITFESKIEKSHSLVAQAPGEEGFELHVKTLLYGDDPKVRDLARRVERGQKIGWSIGGWFTDMHFVENSESEEIERIIVRGVDLDHLATTRKPSNPDTWISQMRSVISSAERVSSYAGGIAIGSHVYWDGGTGQVVEVFLAGTIYDVENGPYEVEVDNPVARIRIYEEEGEAYVVSDRHMAVPISELSLSEQPMLEADEGGPAEAKSIDTTPEADKNTLSVENQNDTQTEEEIIMSQKSVDSNTVTEQNNNDNDARRSAVDIITTHDEVHTMSDNETKSQPDPRIDDLEKRFSSLERSISSLVDTLSAKKEEEPKEEVVVEQDTRSAEITEMKNTISDLQKNLQRATTRTYSRRAFAHRGGTGHVEVPRTEMDDMIEAARAGAGNSSLVRTVESLKERLCSPNNTSLRQAEADLRSILHAAASDGIIHVPSNKNTSWRS